MTGLAALVGDVDTFFEQHLGRKALHRHGVAREVVSLDDVDRVITGSGLRAPGLRVVKDGTVLPPERYVSPSTYGYAGLGDVVDPGKVTALFRDGATIVLGTVDALMPRLHELCKTIEMELGHPVDANIYVAPPGAQAFQVHCDAQDILVVQAHGGKRWTLFDHLEPDPAGGRMLPGLDAPATDYTLREGDVLYVPRGMPHLVRTESSASVHVSISVNTLTWADLLTALTSQLLRSGAYARPLPMGKDVAGQVGPLLKRYADDFAAALADPGHDRLHRAIHGRTACAEGHRAGLLTQALLGTPPAPGERIALRPGTWPLITGEGTRIEAGGRTFAVSPEVGRACRRLQDGPLPVAELPGEVAGTLVELGLCVTSA
ncbi:Cupin superfamily protein [Nonomuraea solani]|uniref:Ribosomal oxygenase 2 n=1 Tax=Nonomuraea solani TaxID=1144553 RepID=A0A1H6ETH0_9ACTN|nr:cupin domain-containing protein [Nonomuraea solani]SEH01158.1 Cupin superfamily protein [Nonomuraea solani]